MATVPYKPYSEVPASTQPIQNVDVPTPAAAFGATIATAIESAGKTVERASDEIFNRAMAIQQLRTEEEAREANVQLTIAESEVSAQYRSLQGKAAVDGQNQYNQDLLDLQRQFRERLSTPAAKRVFDRESRGNTARSIFQGATHAAGQLREQIKKTNVAGIAAIEQEVYNNPSPAALESGLNKVRGYIERIADVSDYGPEHTEKLVRDAQSGVIRQHIAGIARQNPEGAQSVYEKFRKEGVITADDDPKVQTIIKNNLYGVGAERIAAAVVGKVPEDDAVAGMSHREAVVEAGKRARAILDDDAFVEHVQQRTQALLGRRQQLVTSTERNAQYAINSVMAGGINGVRPTSLEELLELDPSMQHHWDRLNPAQRNAWFEKFDRNLRREYTWQEGPDGNRARWRQLQGMATGSLEEINEFLNTDIALEKMPDAGKQQLINLQRATLRKAESNPAVNTAMNYYRNNGLLRDLNATEALDKTRNQQFRGGLVDAMVAFQSVNKRRATTPKDFDEIAQILIRDMAPPNQTDPYGFRIWLFGKPTAPGYELKPNDSQIEDWRKTQKERGVTISPELEGDFVRQWRRREFQKLFSGGGNAPR